MARAMAGTPYRTNGGRLMSPWGVPCNPPPWGTLVALDHSAQLIPPVIVAGVVIGLLLAPASAQQMSGVDGQVAVRVHPAMVPADHPLAATRGADNVIAFTTARYSTTPLVIKGPGAGGEVTAMGVFSDILKLLHYLPK